MVVQQRCDHFGLDTSHYHLGTANYDLYPRLYSPSTYDLEYSRLHPSTYNLEYPSLYTPSYHLFDHLFDLFDHHHHHLFDLFHFLNSPWYWLGQRIGNPDWSGSDS